MSGEDYIACPRFGGRRAAPACVTFDRYKLCRKTCESLEVHLKAYPETVGKAVKKKKTIKEKTLFAGRNLPDAELRCPFCKTFVAKSPRGLKMHCTRTHKKRLL